MLCLSRPLFWLKYCSKGFYPWVCMILYPRQHSYPWFVSPGSTEERLSGRYTLRKQRLHSKQRKVLFNPNSSNNFPGVCNRLNSRNIEPPIEQSFKGQMSLPESNLNSNYVCSPVDKPSGCPGVLSSGNMASTPSFQILTLLVQALHQSQQDFDVSITLDHNPLAKLKWWLLNIDSVNGSPITPPTPTFFIMTDASKTGWGAVFQGHHTKGHWSEDERRLHVNLLKLKATFLALKTFHVTGLRMHNTTAIAHVNNKT